jgi:segregation and condensation protein B
MKEREFCFMDKVMDLKKIESIVEALLFAAGDKVPLVKIASVLGRDKKETLTILNHMIYQYNHSARGIMIIEVNGGYQMCTKPEIYEDIKNAFEPKAKQGLSQAAFETLSIIAYHGPVTKPKMEQIRGVNCDSAITKLLERGLVVEGERLETPGRPLTYDVTDAFFRQFGFSSKADLPSLEMEEILK